MLPSSTPHKKYLTWGHRILGFEGKDVLEIGGCSPVHELLRFSPKSWLCVNLDGGAVDVFNREAQQRHRPRFSAVVQDAATIDPARQFSVVYSINAFEHIQDLRKTLSKIAQVLVPGGRFFTVFGPIWSADIGHHLSIPTESGAIGMFDGVLRPWEHLTSTPAELRKRLEPKLGADVSQRIIEYVFTYPDINRLFESDYMDILGESGLNPVLVIRRKSKQRAPAVAGASRTREFLWVLKKGQCSLGERAYVASQFAMAFAHTRFIERL